MLYVSGYVLRMKNDSPGSCWFSEEGKCRIYERRFRLAASTPICSAVTQMERGVVKWPLFAKMKEHGRYNQEIPEDDCLDSPVKSRDLRMHFPLTRYDSLKKSMNSLPLIVFGMIGKCIVIRRGIFPGENQSRLWYCRRIGGHRIIKPEFLQIRRNTLTPVPKNRD